MDKRTSDFLALAAILGGAGLGLGLTSFYARSAPVAQVDDASLEVRVVPGRPLVRHGSVRPRTRRSRPSDRKPCLKVFVKDRRAAGRIPSSVDGHRVEVEETGRFERR